MLLTLLWDGIKNKERFTRRAKLPFLQNIYVSRTYLVLSYLLSHLIIKSLRDPYFIDGKIEAIKV